MFHKWILLLVMYLSCMQLSSLSNLLNDDKNNLLEPHTDNSFQTNVVTRKVLGLEVPESKSVANLIALIILISVAKYLPSKKKPVYSCFIIDDCWMLSSMTRNFPLSFNRANCVL